MWRVERQATAALHNTRADPAVGRTIQHDGSFRMRRRSTMYDACLSSLLYSACGCAATAMAAATAAAATAMAA